MKTKVFDVSDLEVIGTGEYTDIKMSPETERALEVAAKTLREGGTVAFPTETVYGLGGNAFDPSALRKIFEAKGRPSDNPLIVHIARVEDIDLLASKIPAKTGKLTGAFWPGPLTVVLPKRPEVPGEATGGLSTVAIRMSADPVAAQLISRAGVPVAAPSANLSGRPSPTSASHVAEDLFGRIDVILEGKDTKIGIESTVIDLSDETPVILRPGIITKEQIEEVIGPVEIDPALLYHDTEYSAQPSSAEGPAPKSPGVKYTHYAPKAPMTVIRGTSDEKKTAKIKELLIKAENISAGIAEQKTAMIISEELSVAFSKSGHPQTDYGKIYIFGSREYPEQAAQNLFKILRECDHENVGFIIAEAILEEGIGFAVMNRMLKSAGYNVITV